MNSFDPTICFDAWEVAPPPNRHVLAFDDGEMGWWLAQYFPDEDESAYQPHCWHLVGLDFFKPHVTHWMFLPPAPQRANSDRLLG
jgi:hypothetical protein